VVNWIQGRDLAAVNLAPASMLPSPSEGGDLQTIQLSTGDGDKLPTNDFYMFFPGSTTASPVELPEYVYIATRAADTLLCGPDPFGVSPTTGRAAINPTRWPAAHHPVSARLELRNVFEIYTQLQNRLDAHVHDGTTANGPVLTQAQGTNTVSIINNTGGTLTLGDVVAYSNGQAISVPSTGYLGLPVAVVCSPAGGPPTGGGDYSTVNGASVYVRPTGVAWARCTSTVTAGAPIQTTNAKTVTNLVSPALGAIGFALTAATAYSGGYYCQVLLLNRGSDVLTPEGVQDVKNKTVFSPVLYSSANTTARMSFPTITANDTLIGANTAATLLAKTLTSPVINGGTISGAAITATGAALTSPTITTPSISGNTTYSSSVAKLLVGSTSAGFYNTAGTLPYLIANNTGRVDMPYQAYVQAFYAAAPVVLTSGVHRIPATTVEIDRFGEWNYNTSAFSPSASGIYVFTFALSLLWSAPAAANNVYHIWFETSGGYIRELMLESLYNPTQGFILVNPCTTFNCIQGTSYWMGYTADAGSGTVSISTSSVGISRIG
jgi:hypothetical protein